ncbi:hypothetical protein [Stenotrophomonas phage CM2]
MEVAVASSLALFAGIAGRGWNINRTGLNMHIVLIVPARVSVRNGCMVLSVPFSASWISVARPWQPTSKCRKNGLPSH